MITPKDKKVIVIVGSTSVGKTSLSVELARKLETDVISADSRQVYIGLDIGSGKVTKEEMAGVKHYMLDVADPKDVFSASDFVKLGKESLNKILNEEKIPIIVGGTGFYIDALLEKISLPEVPPNEKLRGELEKLELEELQNRLKEIDPNRFESIDLNNRRRIIRSIEIAEAIGKTPEVKKKSPYKVLWVGLEMETSELRKLIHKRLLDRFESGMLEEAKTLHENGLSYDRMEELGLEYRYMAKHLKNEITYSEMINQLESEHIKYSRRQMTWFKKNKDVNWFSPSEKERVISLAKNFIEQ